MTLSQRQRPLSAWLLAATVGLHIEPSLGWSPNRLPSTTIPTTFARPPNPSSGDETNLSPPCNWSAATSRREVLSNCGSTATICGVAAAVTSTVVAPEPAAAEQGTQALPEGGGERALSAQWSATDGFEGSKDFIQFNADAYVAMRDDARRTPKFKVAIQQRLSGTSGQVVMDVGTGPFALLALMAARAGAAKVYAVESNPEAAKRARQAVAEAKDVAPGVVEIIEGYSTEVTLPQKADLVLAEIVGSVASEEGLCATILDVQRRHAKRPNDPRSFIPNRVQTWCAPASYALHYALGPPEFDWSKLGSEPVRLNCRDQQLQVLSEPLLFEDINLFGDGTEASSRVARNGASGFGTGVGTRLPPGMTLAAATSTASPSSPPSPAAASPDASTLSSPPSPAPLSPLLFEPVSEARLAENTKALRKELGRGGAPDNAATTELAAAMCKSVSGLAFWPKLILDDDGTGNAIGDVNGVDNREAGKGLSGVGSQSQRLIVESRGPKGEHQKSHWQTVLSVMSPRPWALQPGDALRIDRAEVTLAGPVNKPARYAVKGALVSPPGAAPTVAAAPPAAAAELAAAATALL